MDEYISRDEMLKYIAEHNSEENWRVSRYDAGWIYDFIDSRPTADVVPRAEVDELIYKLECFLCHVTGGRLSKHTYDLGTMETVATDCINETYNDGYGEGYKDCAREICEEIEKAITSFGTMPYNNGIVNLDAIAELKKKYIGEQNDDR